MIMAELKITLHIFGLYQEINEQAAGAHKIRSRKMHFSFLPQASLKMYLRDNSKKTYPRVLTHLLLSDLYVDLRRFILDGHDDIVGTCWGGFCPFVFTMVNSPWTDELDQC